MSRVRAGDRFETTGDIATKGMSHWFAPFTGDFDAVIPQGTVLIAADDAVKAARGFYLRPERYEEMEALLVPESDRTDPKYGGYSFVFLDGDIGVKLRQL
jgi:hypothetical protein